MKTLVLSKIMKTIIMIVIIVITEMIVIGNMNELPKKFNLILSIEKIFVLQLTPKTNSSQHGQNLPVIHHECLWIS